MVEQIVIITLVIVIILALVQIFNQYREKGDNLRTDIIVSVIGGIGSVIAAIITGIFANQFFDNAILDNTPTPPPVFIPTLAPDSIVIFWDVSQLVIYNSSSESLSLDGVSIFMVSANFQIEFFPTEIFPILTATDNFIPSHTCLIKHSSIPNIPPVVNPPMCVSLQDTLVIEATEGEYWYGSLELMGERFDLGVLKDSEIITLCSSFVRICQFYLP